MPPHIFLGALVWLIYPGSPSGRRSLTSTRRGNIHYRQALAWAELAPDGTIIVEMGREPRVSSLYPPFDVIEEDSVYEAWIAEMDKFKLYPNYSVEEVGDRWILVARSDGVRFKGVGWLRKTVLMELAGYPSGVGLDEFMTLMILRMAERRPEKFQNPDRDIPEQAHVVIIELGILHNECGLVLVEKAG
jgi:hypothetical protein